MSTDQERRNLNSLDKELADLEKKLADLAKKEADLTKRINDTQRSITKTTSPSTAQSKFRQISGWQNDVTKVLGDKADINKKIAEKRKKRADVAIKLQKEEAIDFTKANKEQQTRYNSYERKIADLTAKLNQQVTSSKPTYQILSNEEQYDVFISHASEDKISFTDALCKELEANGLKVWYDTLSISWGDSQRAKIDEGLKQSKFGIVVISKSYISKGWTKYELDGLFQIEMTSGKTILPIWHNITKDDVQAFSPSLAGRKAMSTALFTIREIADELEKLLGKTKTTVQNDDGED